MTRDNRQDEIYNKERTFFKILFSKMYNKCLYRLFYNLKNYNFLITKFI